MKKIINTIITLFFAICLFISCSQGIETFEEKAEITTLQNGAGTATVKMFIPDYYALAEQKSSRAIAPQTQKVRLSYLVNGNWVGIKTISLSEAIKSPVANAPDNFTGSVYTCTFDGVPTGTYNAGNLQIELLDAADCAITSGTNATSVTIVKGGSASTSFYTVPLSTGANTGNLKAGEMSFTRAALVKGVEYPVSITTSGDYPDLVLFKNNGTLYKYYSIDNNTQAAITLSVDETDVYYLGLWADDGNDIGRYTLSFDFGNGTEIKGVLTGDNLHLTKENSPYIVTGNLLVEESNELKIEPGVIVQFTGAYYLKINGSVNAIGTEAEPIIFVPSGDNLGTWNGISINGGGNLSLESNYEYSTGNIFKNCMIIGASSPLSLNKGTYVDSCTFAGCSGAIKIGSDSLLTHNIIDCNISCSRGTIINNVIHGDSNNTNWGNSSIFTNNNILGNVTVSGYSQYKNNSIKNGAVYFYDFRGVFTANNVYACPISYDSLYTSSNITGNNFIDYEGVIFNSSNTSYLSNEYFNLTGNYWGQSQTEELIGKGENQNLSFITDYYDNFEWMKVYYSNWASELIEGAGYLGDAYIDFDYTINNYTFDVGTYYPESTSPDLTIKISPVYHANEITSMRIAQSLEVLKTTEWKTYNKNINYTVDFDKLADGLATIYVQLKDTKGCISRPLLHEVPYDSPVVNLSITDGTSYSVATSSVELSYDASDKGNIIKIEIKLDDQIIVSDSHSNGCGQKLSGSYIFGLSYMPAGVHSLVATVWDSANNTNSKSVSFSINRNVNNSSYEDSFDSESGQLLKDSDTIYIWHLDNNGKEIGENSTYTVSSYSFATGCLNGYALDVNTSGSIPLELNDNAFTLECWRKGHDYFSISKGSTFSFGASSAYVYYKNLDGSSSYNEINSRLASDNNWHFYSYVYNGNYMAVYRDGVLMSYKDGLNQTLNENDNKIYIYAYNIDELRISKIARSPDDIAAYYNAAKDKIQ